MIRSTSPRRSRLVAAVLGTAMLLPLTALPATADDHFSPEITVSRTTGLDPSGETITVTGSGFDPEANVGTRPPFAGEPNGVYVVFGRFEATWRPSEGAPSTARQVIDQRWAIPPATAGPMMADPSFVPLEDDGSFTATLDVETADGTGDYAVVTYPAGGAVNADHELHVPVAFAADAPPPDFDDVPSGSTHAAAIAELVERRITQGRDATTFAPGAPVTRGQIATFLARAEGLVPPAGQPVTAPESAPFPDVPADHTHAPAIAALADGDVITGYDDGTFRPGVAVRRDQIAVMIARWLKLEPSATTRFDDIEGRSHAGAINALAEARIALGSDGRYQPAATLRRDQMASLLVRALYVTEDGSTVGNQGQLLSATPVTDLDPDGTTVTVTGRGFDESKGIYVAFCVDNGPAAPPGPCVGGADQTGTSGSSQWVSSNPPAYAQGLTVPYSAGGSFEVEIVVRAADDDLDCTAAGVRCVIATRTDHTNAGDRSQDARIPVTFAS